VGEVSRLRLSPRESRFTRLFLVTLLCGPPGPCCWSPRAAGHAAAAASGLSAAPRPFQSAALWVEWREEKGQPPPPPPRRSSAAGSAPPSPPSPPGLSSPQSEPTELLNDSEEILRDDEDMMVAVRQKMTVTAVLREVMMMMVVVMMLQSVPYHVHHSAGESSDSGG